MKVKRNVTSLIAAILSVVTLLTSFTACSTKNNSTQEHKPEITISYVQTGETRDFLLYLKEKFPQYSLTIRQAKEINEVSEDDNGLLLYQVEHNAVADIVLDVNLNISLPGLSTAFADLSGKAYSANYQTSYLNDASIGGAVYYFPLYLTIKGIICNKTLFDERGWKIPESYEEYATLMTQISESPDEIRPIYDEKTIKTVNYCLNTYYSLNEGATPAG